MPNGSKTLQPLPSRLALRSGACERPGEDASPGMGCRDALTGLPNHSAYMLEIERALAFRDARGALLLIDLDLFRSVNGSRGHDCGDCLLCAVAARLNAYLPPGAFLARFDGDEFAVLLHGVTQDGVRAQAERLLECFDEPFLCGELHLLQQASIGVALYPQHGESSSELHSHADLALQHAKQRGRRNWQCYEAGMGAQVRRRQFLLGRLRRALAGNEFFLVFQPRVALASGAVRSWEALLRWDCPDGGAVSPDEFIPVAEESGAIVPIGEWALREACRQFVEWRAQGLDPGSLAVNLSPRQFAVPQLAERIADILAETGMPPTLLELEITETAVMEEFDSAARTLEHLAGLGVGIAIDDFGTGYSSLAYLRRLPVDKLKIDRSFIGALDDSPHDAAIVRTIIELARALGLTVVAEGVETESQLRFLHGVLCHEMQGYLFSRPLCPSACAQMMRDGVRLPGHLLPRPQGPQPLQPEAAHSAPDW
ncbi:bifunctional diguanylate cyclase/phosphodiesterase [Pseudothauera rhizosphaerae]|uniref:Bifunctional diguanylate cyclase/phosphodiesterase n=1 Tax=Pseudothauera rhizosphaerae TaxID=2565932 RepID=A0A4S4AIM2_9RHOO|nr:bifunctional diguanylate cyclase/phosphodiesterase [Pseudothauera rhizosphaerae]